MYGNDGPGLTERLKTSFPGMSDGHRILTRFILDNMETAAFLTAGRLGALVGVSESTVVRFAFALGYQGWPDLQHAMADIVRARLSTVERLRASVAGARDVFHTVMEADLENLKRTMDEIDGEAFRSAVSLIVQAHEVFVLGLRSAQSLALWLAFALQMIGKTVRIVPSGLSSLFEILADAGPEDVVVGISFPRYTDQTVRAFEHARQMGARTIALTDSEVSPLAQVADATLRARTQIGSFVESYVAPLSLLNALVTAVGQKDEKKASSSLERFEELCSRHNVYWTPAS